MLIYILIPLISALIGWITNFLAVKMIFRPHLPINFYLFKIQGLIPKRQVELAESIGETVQNELFSHKDILEIIKQPETQKKINIAVENEINRFIQEKLTKNPLIGIFLEGEAGTAISQMLIGMVKDSMPEISESLFEHLEEDLDVSSIVKSKILGFELRKIEKIIYKISAKELKMIEILGGVLGFIVGIGQVILIQFS